MSSPSLADYQRASALLRRTTACSDDDGNKKATPFASTSTKRPEELSELKILEDLAVATKLWGEIQIASKTLAAHIAKSNLGDNDVEQAKSMLADVEQVKRDWKNITNFGEIHFNDVTIVTRFEGALKLFFQKGNRRKLQKEMDNMNEGIDAAKSAAAQSTGRRHSHIHVVHMPHVGHTTSSGSQVSKTDSGESGVTRMSSNGSMRSQVSRMDSGKSEVTRMSSNGSMRSLVSRMDSGKSDLARMSSNGSMRSQISRMDSGKSDVARMSSNGSMRSQLSRMDSGKSDVTRMSSNGSMRSDGEDMPAWTKRHAHKKRTAMLML